MQRASREGPWPGGEPPPRRARLLDAGGEVELEPLAREICERHYAVFPDELERYGERGVAWCRHDNQWILSWVAGDLRGYVSLAEQVAWLARVLDARGYPAGRLAADLRTAADVLSERLGEQGAAAARALRAAAEVAEP